MLVLTAADVETVLPIAVAIDGMAEALRGLAEGRYLQPDRIQARAEGAALLGLMPAFRAGPDPVWVVKTVLFAPGNRSRGLATHQGFVALYDGETGCLRALVDASAITAIRTAAASALATRILAMPDAACVAIVGTGTQARSHVSAMRTILPNARILVAGRSPEHAAALATTTGSEAATVESAVRQANIVCTVTAAGSPILHRSWVQDGCHINAVGASSPGRREIDGVLMATSESRSQALSECGEYRMALAEGLIRPEHIRAELGEVLVGRQKGRSSPEAITIFKSLGMAVEDLRSAELAVELARVAGLGCEVLV